MKEYEKIVLDLIEDVDHDIAGCVYDEVEREAAHQTNPHVTGLHVVGGSVG